MQLSISEAARRAGVERQVLYRKIQKGLLSKVIQDDGSPIIDLSELARMYPKALAYTEQPKQQANRGTGQVTPETLQHENTLLRERISGLEADKTALRHDLEHERGERHKERDEAREERKRHLDMLEKAHLQLAAFRVPPMPPEPPKAATAAPAAPPQRNLWARLTGRAYA